MFKSSVTRTLCAALLISLPGFVSAAQTCNPNIPLTNPDSRYTYNVAADEVTDTMTGLIWKRCAEGMSWSGSTCTGTATIFTWEDSLLHANTQTGWRMPNLKELTSLVEKACKLPARNQNAFPAAPSSVWSSSPAILGTDGVWYVNYSYGTSHWNNRTRTFSVRLVRG